MSDRLTKLPIDSLLGKIVEELGQHSSLILQASPGSGKTTRVPAALLRALAPHQEILVLEPRRLAAKFAARRVADEWGEPVGQTIGYQFRFENLSSAKTRLRFLTEGVFLRRLLNDPDLRKVGIVIVDEFHERHLQTDLALGYLRHLQRTRRPDLKVVVMSATLDLSRLETFLGSAKLLELELPIFPLEISYIDKNTVKAVELLVREAVENIIKNLTLRGDILIFLPGLSEIRKCEQQLASLAMRNSIVVHALHGDLTRDEQDAAVMPGPRRKIILSTNIAESSLTIEGVRIVIDSGLHRLASFSHWNGLPSLKTAKISKASAIQRAGRAARLGPGLCLRLYSKLDFDGRAAFEDAEIHRADLAQSVLELKKLGIQNLRAFDWFEAPDEKLLAAAEKNLFQLGALSSNLPDAQLSDIGRELTLSPSHPRVGRFLIEARRRGVLEAAAHIAAFISEAKSDDLDILSSLHRTLNPVQKRIKDQLLGAMTTVQGKNADAGAKGTHGVNVKDSTENALAQSLLLAFPDRVAKKRVAADGISRMKSGQVELILSGAPAALVDNNELIASHEFFVVIDAQELSVAGQKSRPVVRSLCAIQQEWLFDVNSPGVSEEEIHRWDEKRERVMLESRLKYDQLVLTETLSEARPGPQSAAILLKQLFPFAMQGEVPLTQWIEALAQLLDREKVTALFAKRKLLKQYFPESGVGDISSSQIEHTLKSKLAEVQSLEQARAIDWEQALLADVAADFFHRLETLLPRALTLPSGRKVAIHYELEQAPWIASRLQDFFGLRESPKILNGRLTLTVHLLAPNQRPIQITSDLAGFWQRAYLELRPQLSRRYPRQSWPEKP